MSLNIDQIAETFCSHGCAETTVVGEGAAQFQDQKNQISSVASCDNFQFSDGRLVEIRSYVIELSKP